MILCELFNDALPLTWKTMSKSDGVALFSVNNKEYYVHCKARSEGYLEIEFALLNDEKVRQDDMMARTKSHNITGSGDQFKVLSTVVSAVRQYLSKFPHDTIMMIADPEEPSRSKLYIRMLKTLLPGWAIELTDWDMIIAQKPKHRS